MKIELTKIKDLSKNLDKEKITLIILIIMIFIVLDFYSLLGIQLKAVKNIDLKIKKLKKELKTFQNDYSQMQEAIKKPPKQSYRTIGENEMSLLIEEISHLAKESNVEISQIKPQKETKSSTSISGFIPYLFYLNLNSDYYSFLRFIKSLEEDPIIMGVEELEISPNPKNIFKHNINLILKVYVKK